MSGFGSSSRENVSPEGLQFATLGAIFKNILKPAFDMVSAVSRKSEHRPVTVGTVVLGN